jgi:hypothetical protein
VITGESRRAASRLRPAGPLRPRRETAAWAAGTAAAAVALFTCYLRQSRTVAVGSDGASQALQAWDMLHGNLLLHGWWVTDVSFYTTELPQYAGIELVHGLSANVMHLAGAMTYTLLVLTAAFLARGRSTGRAGVTRAVLAAGIMLAPQLGAGTQTLVLSPDHTGTSVPVLLIWLLIDRAPERWYVPVLVWLSLAWTAVADPMTLFVAVLPLAAVCSFRLVQGALRNRALTNQARKHRALPNTALPNTALPNTALPNTALPNTALPNTALENTGPPSRTAYELALLAAAVLAIPAELAATALIRALGGWQVHGLATSLGGTARLAANARLAGQGLLMLFGADISGASSASASSAGPAPAGTALAVAFAVVHLAGVALAVAGVATALRRLAAPGRPADLIESLLLAGIAVDLAGYLAGVQAVNILSTREIAPVLPFAAVLAGRTVGDRLLGDRLLGDRLLAGWPRRALRYGLCGVLAGYAAMLGYAAAQPPAAPQYADLAGWLRAEHLTNGLSGYHQANIVTLESGGLVTLRAVEPTDRGRVRVRAYPWNASLRWYDPSGHSANFLVLTTPGLPAAPDAPDAPHPPDAATGSSITVAEAVATFGRPSERRRYHAYTILIWPHGENLLARLG